MARTAARPSQPPAGRGSVRSLARPAAIAVAAAVALTVAPAGASAAPSVAITAPPIEGPLPTKAKTVKVAVQNVGKRKLTGLSLNVRAVKGVRITVVGAKKGKATRKLSTLKAGKTTRVSVRLQRLKGGPKTGAVTVRVLRGKRTQASQRVEFGVNPNTLAKRYFWGSTFTISGIAQKTLYFSNDNLVFTNDMEAAYANCTAADENCRPYQYVAKGNQLQIDGKPATLDGRKLEYDGQTYFEFAAPPAGSRWDALMTYSNSSGICPLYCSYFTEKLRFLPDGQVARDAVSSGSGPVVDWAVVPPSNRGTYEVRADGTIRIAFADGKERIETIAFYVGDDGKLKPANEGMILGGDGYFDIEDK
jgi:hypothetical protein